MIVFLGFLLLAKGAMNCCENSSKYLIEFGLRVEYQFLVALQNFNRKDLHIILFEALRKIICDLKHYTSLIGSLGPSYRSKFGGLNLAGCS